MSCATRRYAVDETYFDDIDTPEKAYWLGFLFADGYHNGREMIVNLAPVDVDHLERLKAALSAEQPVRRVGNNRVSLRISSQRLCEALDRTGCVRAKSLTLEAPRGLPDGLVWSFIAGFFDGDGCISLQEKGRYARVSMHCAAPIFRGWLLAAVRSAGIRATNPNSQQGRNVAISNRAGVEAFENLIYEHVEHVALQRKRVKFTTFRR